MGKRPPVRNKYTEPSSTGAGVDPGRGDDNYMDGNGSTGPDGFGASRLSGSYGVGGESGRTPYNGKEDFDPDVHRTTPGISAVQAPNRPR